MLKKLFSKKKQIGLVETQEIDVVLRLMFEIAISDGNLDDAELKLIKERAKKITAEESKSLSIVEKIINETEQSTSLYPTVKKINEAYSINEKKDLLKILWELITADGVIDPYEEHIYFKIAELIKIKRSSANQIKQESS